MTESALAAAIKAGESYFNVKKLVKAGADPNDGNPLHLAIEKGNELVVKLLLKHKADVNAKDACGRTPLYRAIEKGRDFSEYIVTKLVRHGATDENSWRLEMMYHGHAPLVNCIFRVLPAQTISRLANEKNERGEFLLDECVRHDNAHELVHALLQHGVNPNNFGEKMVEWIMTKGNEHVKVLRSLRDAGMNESKVEWIKDNFENFDAFLEHYAWRCKRSLDWYLITKNKTKSIRPFLKNYCRLYHEHFGHLVTLKVAKKNGMFDKYDLEKHELIGHLVTYDVAVKYGLFEKLYRCRNVDLYIAFPNHEKAKYESISDLRHSCNFLFWRLDHILARFGCTSEVLRFFFENGNNIYLYQVKEAMETYIDCVDAFADLLLLKNVDTALELRRYSDDKPCTLLKLVGEVGMKIPPSILFRLEDRHVGIVKDLLEHCKLDIDSADPETGDTPAMFALKSGKKKLVAELYKLGADFFKTVNAKGESVFDILLEKTGGVLDYRYRYTSDLFEEMFTRAASEYTGYTLSKVETDLVLKKA